MQDELLTWLMRWFQSCCDGDWEHMYGVKISTLDNPGWHVSICLHETPLENKHFTNVSIERSDHDWVFCFIKNKCFEIAGGSQNLGEGLSIFREWVEKPIDTTVA